MVPVSGEIKEESSNFEHVNFVSDNEVKGGNDGTLLTLIYKDAIDTIHQVNDITDHTILNGKTLLQTHVKDWEVIHAQVKSWDDQSDQYQEMFLIRIVEGQDTDIMTYDTITKVLDMKFQHESKIEDKWKFLSFQDIKDHRIIKKFN